jgi:hypothetical protein
MRKYFPSNTLSVSWEQEREAMTSSLPQHASPECNTHRRDIFLPSALEIHIVAVLYEYSLSLVKRRISAPSLLKL